MKSQPKNEFRIPIVNNSSSKVICEFKILQGGHNANMHTFYLMPFRFGIPAGGDLKLMLTVKYNIQTFDDEQFRKMKEIRKILNVHIKDTSINIAFPILITIATPNAPTRSLGGRDLEI